MRTMQLETNDTRECQISIAAGLLSKIGEVIPSAQFDGIFLIHDPAVSSAAHDLAKDLECKLVCSLTGGESAKNLNSLSRLAEDLLKAGANRKSLLIAMGGGVVCDLVAFLASVYMRGVACALVPTSMLAMVDAAIGGKNGVDLGEFKNILGTIRQPDMILVDPKLLQSLPDAELRDGLVEVVKKAAVLNVGVFKKLCTLSDDLLKRDEEALEYAIISALEMKTDVVRRDEREQGLRKVLNFGHTVGHALESLSNFTLSHGAAVALGMQIEMSMGPRPSAEVLTLLTALKVDLNIPDHLQDADQLWQVMQKDKKNQDGSVYIAIPGHLGQGILLPIQKEDLVQALNDHQQKSIKLNPLHRPFNFATRLPGSKSEANRTIVLAALQDGETIISNATPCDDVKVMVNGLKSLGFNLEWINETRGDLRVVGGIPSGSNDRSVTEIHCGNAGTALRFLISVAALVPGNWSLTGDAYMLKRPIGPLVDAWRELGVEMVAQQGRPPVQIQGGHLNGGEVTLDASTSSQFLTSLLQVGSKLKGGLTVKLQGQLASSGYVELTQEVMGKFGHHCHQDGTSYRVDESKGTPSGALEIEGCWSSAGIFYVLAELVGGQFMGVNLNQDSMQSDRLILKHITAMKAEGDLEVDVSETPDQLMNLSVLAARRKGSTRFVGAANLRHKECDRLQVLCRELTKAGVEIEEHEDGVVVRDNKASPQWISFDPEHDHRMAMALAAVGLMRYGCEIGAPECVSKSFPSFWARINQLQRACRPLILVGMRGAGKTTLGANLSNVLLLPHVDSDAVFEERHGDITKFVEDSGWEEFRQIEASICQELLNHDGIISLGGGALENESTAEFCRQNGFVIWLDESVSVLQQRIQESPLQRPSVTGQPILDELGALHQRRQPQFADTHHFRIPPGLSPQEQMHFTMLILQKRCHWPLPTGHGQI
ncbi:MAG: pentafunctional AROM polypeptide [Planctomycetota bacterium]|jgi:pentafunctional AROM polypeptide